MLAVLSSWRPARSHPSKLRQYESFFDALLLCVTGDNAPLGNLAGQLGAPYEVAVTPGMNDYPVYHTAAVFLVDPRARYHAVFAPPLDAERISERFKVLRELEGPKAT